MLTSKEIMERTGISRATLNNYIASGLVPRPQVLPPGPEHGAAPRIGYFPDDTVARVEEIQRLKAQGWSIARIAAQLPAHPPAQVAAGIVPPAPVTPVAAAAGAAARSEAAGNGSSLALSLPAGPMGHPAYLVNDAFRVTWANEETRTDALSPLAHRAGVQGSSIFSQLLSVDPAKGGDALLRFHLQVAQARGATAGALFRGLPPDEASRLQGLFDQPRRGDTGLLMQASLPAADGLPARTVYAVRFREGVLFAYAGQDEAGSVAVPVPARKPAAPVVTPVAVLVSTLEDAGGLWVRLPAQEYFELLNEVWAELDRVFRRHRGRAGPQGGEVLVCYFLPQADGSHLWNALAAAREAREAMRALSQRWAARKGWDLELAMNVGIDEGQEWMGVVGATGEGALRVVGDTADHAEQLSRVSRGGAILVTRSLLGKLPSEHRDRLKFGVPRFEGARAEPPLLSTFARLADIAAPRAVPARVADLAAAELIDLHSPNNSTSRPQEG